MTEMKPSEPGSECEHKYAWSTFSKNDHPALSRCVKCGDYEKHSEGGEDKYHTAVDSFDKLYSPERFVSKIKEQLPAAGSEGRIVGLKFCDICKAKHAADITCEVLSEGTGEVMDLKKRAEEIQEWLYGPMMFRDLPSEGLVVEHIEQALRQVREETIEQCASIVDRSVKIHVKPNQSGESWLECLKTPPELSTEIRELKMFTRRTNVVNVSWNRLCNQPSALWTRGRGSMKFPKHDASLHLQHNDHKSSYETVGEYLEQGHLTDFYEFKNDEQKKRSIETNELWTLQWYPNTPVGFNAVAAPTLEELLDFANEEEK